MVIMQNLTDQNMSFQHDIKLCGSVSKQNYSTLSERHLLTLWRNNSPTLLTQGTLGYIWITIAVVGFIINITQICWVLSRGKKTVIDVFIVSLAVSKLKILCCCKVLGQQMKTENKPAFFTLNLVATLCNKSNDSLLGIYIVPSSFLQKSILIETFIFGYLKWEKTKFPPFWSIILQIVDLQVCCLNIPFQVWELFHDFDWSNMGAHAPTACMFHWFFRHGSVVSGSIMMSLIAVSR